MTIAKVCQVEVSGWRENADKIGADKLLAHDANLGLKAGKAIVDEVTAGRVAEFTVADEEVAADLVAKLQGFNFIARVVRR